MVAENRRKKNRNRKCHHATTNNTHTHTNNIVFRFHVFKMKWIEDKCLQSRSDNEQVFNIHYNHQEILGFFLLHLNYESLTFSSQFVSQFWTIMMKKKKCFWMLIQPDSGSRETSRPNRFNWKEIINFNVSSTSIPFYATV